MAKKRIYIIEDNADYSLFLFKILEHTGWAEPVVFNESLSGLEACLTDPPHCLILDIDLPILRGEEICRILRSKHQTRDLPIIVVSQLPDPQKREMEMLQLGADVYFAKPVPTDEFLNTILLMDTLREEIDEQEPIPIAPEIREEQSPTRFQGYDIIEMIGGGGMGTVYKARQIRLDRIVAIKVLSPQFRTNPTLQKRFEREARILAQLSHPNIVQVIDVGSSEYAPFFVMEFVEGITLEERIKAAPVSLDQGIGIIKQTSDALIYLHSRDIIHRDIKPSNIMISTDGIVKITDFGVSRAHLPNEFADFTQVSLIMGTPAYMSPESVKKGKVTQLSDQFSLGLTIWRMFTGKSPGKSSRPVSDFRSDLPPELSPVLERCMKQNPEERFPSIKAARDAILKALGISSISEIDITGLTPSPRKNITSSETRILPDQEKSGPGASMDNEETMP